MHCDPDRAGGRTRRHGQRLPVSLVGDGSGGGALIADPGSVWRWRAGAASVRLLWSPLAPVHVAALDGGRATGHRSGQWPRHPHRWSRPGDGDRRRNVDCLKCRRLTGDAALDPDRGTNSIWLLDDGRLRRIDATGSPILTTAPALAKVRVQTNGSVWGVTNAGGVVRLVDDRFVQVDAPRDLAVIASDERDGRLAIVGRDATVAVRLQGRWFRLSSTTAQTPDRWTNRPAAPRPTDIAVLPDGGILVADAGRDPLLVYRESASS